MDVFFDRVRDVIRSRKGPRYQQVFSEVKGTTTAWRDRSSSRAKYAVYGVGTFVALGFLLLIGKHMGSAESSSQDRISSTGNGPPSYLHMVLAVPNSDPNFCKTIMSAAVLGYPSTALVGWGETLDHPQAPVDVPAIKEVYEIQKKLDWKADDDVLIIVNGRTSWFQLRPQTLLDRYFEINRRADQRLRDQFGEQVVADYNLTQKIVFTAQKTCSLWGADDPACYAMPASTLPTSIYGSKTDVATSDDHSQVRPRYMSPGVIVGTAKEVRALYEEVATRMVKDSNLRTPQHALTQIFGDQEVYREIVRRIQPKTWGQSFGGLFSTDPREALFKPEHLDKVANRGTSSEFGIGLDYESEIGFSTESSTNDVAWLTAHDPFQKDKTSGKTVQPDIATTLPPFFTFTEEGLDRNAPWETVPLLTNVRTGITPAVISHTGDKALMQSWWSKVWFQEHARTLYNAHINAPIGPIAMSGNGTTRAWWTFEDYRGGARNSAHKWFRYDDVCAGTEDEVFRDGRGRWILPQDH